MFHPLSLMAVVLWNWQSNWNKKSETQSNFNYEPLSLQRQYSSLRDKDFIYIYMFSNEQEKLHSKLFLYTTGPLMTGNNFYFLSSWNVNNQSKTFPSLCLERSAQQSYYSRSIVSLMVKLK